MDLDVNEFMPKVKRHASFFGLREKVLIQFCSRDRVVELSIVFAVSLKNGWIGASSICRVYHATRNFGTQRFNSLPDLRRKCL